MPVYEFICLSCKGRKKPFQVVQSMAAYDRRKIKCPRCRSKRVERHWTSIFTVTSKKS